mgnify:FL=1|jgi:hypothetical protein
MINNIETYLTYQNIYLIVNSGVLPLWLMLLFMPNHYLTRFFTNTVIVPLLLAVTYIFISYKIYLDGSIFEGFSLYIGLDNLYSLFSEESFLLVFWIHFLSISLFVGGYIARDAQRYLVPRFLCFISILITYFAGPVGLLLYWFVRIFFSKKISFND